MTSILIEILNIAQLCCMLFTCKAREKGAETVMGRVPHLVQYQGSKRVLAPEIIRYFPEDIETLYEPFCGTCAVTILAAQEG